MTANVVSLDTRRPSGASLYEQGYRHGMEDAGAANASAALARLPAAALNRVLSEALARLSDDDRQIVAEQCRWARDARASL